MYANTRIIVFVAFCLAAAQASAIGRKGSVPKESVEVKNNGVIIKTGYEGYYSTVPKTEVATKENVKDKQDFGGLFSTSQIDVLTGLMMFKSGLAEIGLKIGKILLSFVAALFVGIATTTALCHFTPLCHISLNENKTPAFLSGKKEILPALKEALEVVSRIPNFFGKEQSPAESQPEEAKSATKEVSEQSVEPRHAERKLDNENIENESSNSNVKDNEA